MTKQNELFNRHWAVYQAIIANNAMFHKEFAMVADRVFSDKAQAGPLDILDLGCGDGSHIQPVLKKVPVHAYTGYDLSEAALDIAHGNLAPVVPALHLLEGRMEELIEREQGRFDVMYSGYAVHHLTDTGKQELLKRIHALLRPGGLLMLVDVFREEGQTRDDYLNLMKGWIQRTWDFLDQGQKELVFEHLHGFDHPAMRSMATAWGEEAGFRVDWNPAFDKWHHAVVMRKAGA